MKNDFTPKWILVALLTVFIFSGIGFTGLNAQTNTFPASGYVGIGTTVPGFALTAIGTEWNSSQISLTTYAGTPTPGGTDNYTPQFRFEKARGTAIIPTKVLEGDRLGAFLAAGHDGSKMQRSAVFGFRVDGPTSLGTVPIGFFVQTGDNSANKPERFLVKSDGGVVIKDLGSGSDQFVVANDTGLLGTLAILDNDATNELQTLGYNSSTGDLSISSGNTVNIQDSDWITSGSNIYNGNAGNVSIGTTDAPSELSVGAATDPSISIGTSTFNNPEAGRLSFSEDLGGGTCGFEFRHNGAENRLYLVSGCIIPAAGDTVVAFTRSEGYTLFPNFVNMGSMTNPTADLHIKQSTSGFPNPSTGGIIFEQAAASTTQWQVWSSNPFLSFAYNGTRVAYVNNSTGAWTTTSDRSLKRDITPMESVLDRVNQLEPVEFFYNSQESGAKVKGFVAQDVEEVFPEIVYQDAPGAPKALSHGDFAVLAIKAIQEQQELIESQQAQMEEMNTRLEAMEALYGDLSDGLRDCCVAHGNTGHNDRGLHDQEGSDLPHLQQNMPNPFDQETVIRYFIPSNARNAQIRITTIEGQLIQHFPIEEKGYGEQTVQGNSLAAGNYLYTLMVDGEVIATRKMVLTR